MTISTVFDAAADLLEREGAWTQGATALDAKGHQTEPCSDTAVCFCMAGALVRVGDIWNYSALRAAIRPLLPRPSKPQLEPLVAFNDATGRTQAEVVSKLREAALRAREAGR